VQRCETKNAGARFRVASIDPWHRIPSLTRTSRGRVALTVTRTHVRFILSRNPHHAGCTPWREIATAQWQYTLRQLRTARRKYAPARAVRSHETFLFDKAGSSSERVESDLTTANYAASEARSIDRALADRARLRRVDSQTGGEIVGRKKGNYAGILIPVLSPRL
jgi:hypothetical protein